MGATLSRRDLLRVSGAAAGGVALGGTGFAAPAGATAARSVPEGTPPSQRYTRFGKLPEFNPYDSSDKALPYGTMRITLLGTTGYIPRLTGMANSVFVELGNRPDGPGDSLVYLTTIYAFGPSYDRKYAQLDPDAPVIDPSSYDF